jgi:endonuclease/exonuclease/phosphatase (EEP) superfamily protein YafD
VINGPVVTAASARAATGAVLLRAVTLTGWAVLAVLLGLAFLRIAHLDDRLFASVLSSAAPVAFLAAYPVLVVVACRRQRAASLVALVCIALHLWWFHAMLPLVHRDRALPAGATALRVMTANLLFTNTRAGELGPEISSEKPDLLALEEFSDHTSSALEASGALNAFPYHLTHVTYQPSGIALYSRLPLRDAQVVMVAGRPVITAVVVTAAGPVTVVVVHTVAPLDGASNVNWRTELRDIADMAATVRGPLIVVGDFNATDGNRPFVTIKSRGDLADVLDATGKGYATTWPQTLRLFPPLVRPDHILVGRGVVALRGRTMNNPGSDHRAVVADLGVRPQ